MTGPLTDRQLDEIAAHVPNCRYGCEACEAFPALADEIRRLRGENQRLRAEAPAPSRSAITRRLKAAGYHQWAGKTPDERKVPGFRVALNRQITPGGVAVIHMAQFDDAQATDAALNQYAETLRSAGYSAEVRTLVGSLRGVAVGRPARAGSGS